MDSRILVLGGACTGKTTIINRYFKCILSDVRLLDGYYNTETFDQFDLAGNWIIEAQSRHHINLANALEHATQVLVLPLDCKETLALVERFERDNKGKVSWLFPKL